MPPATPPPGPCRSGVVRLPGCREGEDEAQALLVYTATPGTEDRDRLDLLAVIAAGLPEDAPRVIVGVRPSDFALAGPDADPDAARLCVVADVVERLGSERRVIFGVDAPRVATDAVTAASDEPADGGAVLLADEGRSLFTAVLDGRAPVAVDDALELTMSPERIYLFDPATGRALHGPPAVARP